MAHYEMTISISALKPATAKKLAALIEEAADDLFFGFTMNGRSRGPVGMTVGKLKEVKV